jgi:hypothetical protein
LCFAVPSEVVTFFLGLQSATQGCFQFIEIDFAFRKAIGKQGFEFVDIILNDIQAAAVGVPIQFFPVLFQAGVTK